MTSEEKNFIEIEKDLTKLLYSGNYDHVKLEINFHFYNHLWNNNTAYIMINDHIYWLDHHNWKEGSCNAERWNSNIRIVHKQVTKDLKLKFGIKLHDGFRLLTDELTSCIELMNILAENKTIRFDNFNIFIK
jgi:hypothetical protein